VIDIDKINKRHFLETDMYYRVELGLSSRLLRYVNGVIHLEVIVGRKWERNYNAAAAEIAYCWKKTNEELKPAIACKVYIVDLKKHPHKHILIDSDISVNYDAKKGILFYKDYLN
jgi:hypothetical protein